MIITRRTLTVSVLVTATTLALDACGSSKPQTPATAPITEAIMTAPTQSVTPASTPTVPDYHPDEVPSIPLFSVPAIDVFASDASEAVAQAASSSLVSVPGVMVSPARCDGTSLASGSAVLGGDGPAASSSDRGAVANDGTGSGTITEGPISIIYGGDGSGAYSSIDTMVIIAVEVDGPGIYSMIATGTILDGNGGGNYSNANSMESIISNDDGSDQFSKGTVTIINNSDGTGSYLDEKLTIQNNGNGTATVNGVTVSDASEVEKVSELGEFPATESPESVESYGTVITLEDGIPFDFGKSDIRLEAARTLKSLAGTLNNTKVPATRIYGHTDSVSDEALDLQLSQERAGAVFAGLRKDDVSTTLDATGYSESKPVAPNESADGSDNLAGRMLNRRVEIFIPTF